MNAVAVAREALGEDGEWLVVEAGPAPPDAVSLTDLAADPGAIDRIVASWVPEGQEPAAHLPADVISWVAWCLYQPRLLAVRDLRRELHVDPASIRVVIDHAEHEGPVRVWWPDDAAVAVVADDAAAVQAAYRRLVQEAVTAFEPLVRTVRGRVSIGMKGLWGRVADVFVRVGPHYSATDPDRLCVELALMERAWAGTALRNPVEMADVATDIGLRRHVRTIACCLAYTHPHEYDDGEAPPWADGPWAGYCMSCPLIPMEETAVRARYWLAAETAGASAVDTDASPPGGADADDGTALADRPAGAA